MYINDVTRQFFVDEEVVLYSIYLNYEKNVVRITMGLDYGRVPPSLTYTHELLAYHKHIDLLSFFFNRLAELDD